MGNLSIRAMGILVSLAIVLVMPLRAQWVQLPGLSNGSVSGLAALGPHIYALTSDLQYSSNNGQDWSDAGGGGVIGLVGFGHVAFAGSMWNGLQAFNDSGSFIGNVFCCWQGQNDVWSGGTMEFFYGEHYGLNATSDSGRSWFKVPSGAYPFFGDGSLMIGSDSLNRVVRSTDLGVSWKTVTGLPDSPNYRIEMTNTAIVATNGTEMFRSTDRGFSWAAAGAGIASAHLIDIATTTTTALVSTYNGIYRSSDDGLHWSSWNDGLGSDTVGCFAINDQYVFAGTFGQGAWRRPVSELSAVQSPPIAQAGVELYPNPTSGIVTIRDPRREIRRIKVMNALGIIVLEVTEPDGAESSLDLSKLPPAIYFLQITTPGSVLTLAIIKE